MGGSQRNDSSHRTTRGKGSQLNRFLKRKRLISKKMRKNSSPRVRNSNRHTGLWMLAMVLMRSLPEPGGSCRRLSKSRLNRIDSPASTPTETITRSTAAPAVTSTMSWISATSWPLASKSSRKMPSSRLDPDRLSIPASPASNGPKPRVSKPMASRPFRVACPPMMRATGMGPAWMRKRQYMPTVAATIPKSARTRVTSWPSSA